MKDKYGLTYDFDESRFGQYLEVFAAEFTKALATAPADAFKIIKFISDKTGATKPVKNAWKFIKPCENSFHGTARPF